VTPKAHRYVLAVPGFLRAATIVVALIAAAWATVAAVRQKAPDRSHFVALAAVQTVATVLAIVAIGKLFGGAKPAEYATFIGYLACLVLVPGAGWALARLEPTRWGTVIIAIATAVEAVLVLRLQQLWTGHG
jgi:hypothetical protein